MDIVMYSLFIFIIICILIICYITIFNKFQGYIIRVNEAEANIDSVLRKRFDLLNKSIGIINGNIECDKEVLEIIVKLRSRKLTNFELDRLLYDAINEFHHYKAEYPTLCECENFIKIGASISESESEIYALRRYYNDVITDYNKAVRTFPSNVVALTCHYQQKTYFDGKNMTDQVINDFKL